MEDNLQLCLVRQAPPNIDRACCFELVTPSKNHLLQADSDALCAAWIKALQRTIQHLHESGQGYKSTRQSVINPISEGVTPTSTKNFLNGIPSTSIGSNFGSSATMPAQINFKSSTSNTDIQEVSPRTKRREQAQADMKKRMQEHLYELTQIPG